MKHKKIQQSKLNQRSSRQVLTACLSVIFWAGLGFFPASAQDTVPIVSSGPVADPVEIGTAELEQFLDEFFTQQMAELGIPGRQVRAALS